MIQILLLSVYCANVAFAPVPNLGNCPDIRGEMIGMKKIDFNVNH